MDWNGRCQEAGFGDAARLRYGGPQMVAAANAVLSDVIDSCFSWPQSLAEIAHQFGFPMLENADLGGGTQDLIDMFIAVCRAHPPLGADADRFSGPGWKIVSRGSANDLARAWEKVCDSGWVSSRRCESEDWANVLHAHVDGEIHCDVRPHGQQKIGIRFRVGTSNLPILVNDQIINPDNLAPPVVPMTQPSDAFSPPPFSVSDLPASL